jgi:predicted MFS family arabinose efflux permease
MNARSETWSYSSFRFIFFGRGISLAGNTIQTVAATWYAYHLTNSAAAVGILAALTLGPSIFGGPVGGFLLDRFDVRRLAIALNLISALPVILLTFIAFTGELSIGWLYVLVFLSSIPDSLNQPVSSLVGPATVPQGCRHAAVALLSLSFNISQIIGGPIGGLIVTHMGVWMAFALNAVSYLIIAYVESRVRLVSGAIVPDVIQSDQANKLGDGLKILREMPFLRLAAISVLAFFVFAAPVQQLMPIIAGSNTSAAVVGYLLGAIGIGSLLANPFIGCHEDDGQEDQKLMKIGLFMAALGLMLLSVYDHYGLLLGLIAAVMIGFAWEFVFVGGTSTAAVSVPTQMSGRTMGMFFFVANGGSALGAFGLSLLSHWLGAQLMLLTAAVMILIAAFYLLLNRQH